MINRTVEHKEGNQLVICNGIEKRWDDTFSIAYTLPYSNKVEQIKVFAFNLENALHELTFSAIANILEVK